MMTVIVADELPPGWAAVDAGVGGVVVVVSTGGGGASMIVTTRVPVGGGVGCASGWTATAALTPPAASRTAAARPKSAPPFPNTLPAPSDDDSYEVLVRSSTAVVLRTFVEMTGPIDAQISVRWHQWRHRTANTRGPSGPHPPAHFARSAPRGRQLELKVHVGVAE
jgi:hypothetical protein